MGENAGHGAPFNLPLACFSGAGRLEPLRENSAKGAVWVL